MNGYTQEKLPDNPGLKSQIIDYMNKGSYAFAMELEALRRRIQPLPPNIGFSIKEAVGRILGTEWNDLIGELPQTPMLPARFADQVRPGSSTADRQQVELWRAQEQLAQVGHFNSNGGWVSIRTGGDLIIAPDSPDTIEALARAGFEEIGPDSNIAPLPVPINGGEPVELLQILQG